MEGKTEGSGEKRTFWGNDIIWGEAGHWGRSAQHVQKVKARPLKLPVGCTGRLRRVKQISASQAAVGTPNTWGILPKF